MTQRPCLLLTVLLAVAALGCAVGSLETGAERFDVPTITKEELRPRLGAPGLVVLDVRFAEQWEAVRHKVAGALWEEPEQVAFWAGKYSKADEIVLYCA